MNKHIVKHIVNIRETFVNTVKHTANIVKHTVRIS